LSGIAIIGGGFSGLSAACYAAQAGFDVSLHEKNSILGGRARCYSEHGFMFDMGPSWYWMPDVFDKFFASFGKSVSDYYNLIQLDPGFQIFYKEGDVLQVPADSEKLFEVFESRERGSAKQLKRFLAESENKYKLAMNGLVQKPSISWSEYIRYDIIKGVIKHKVFQSFSRYVRKFFKDESLIGLMEFPVLFLGAMPQNIPALYSLMNFAALSLGTWYPMGGMYEIIKAFESLARELGVDIQTNSEVQKIASRNGLIKIMYTNNNVFLPDAVIASCDYNHTEQKLLNESDRNYSSSYWVQKTFAPSCLIYYVGVNKKIKKLIHHNLFFDADMDAHSSEIYDEAKWPQDPLFYVCCPSKTDVTVAPEGMENLFILVPIAPGLEDTEEMRNTYFERLVRRIEKKCEDRIWDHIIYKKSYCINDFVNDYHAYKGNAYGLANTITQTAVLKPSVRNRSIKNLFYAGQLTVPGPGVPPSIISGQIAASQAQKFLKKNVYERVV
jgi:phytoene desaturase